MISAILIADDHFVVQKGMQMMVHEALGYKCPIEVAGNGKQVIEKLKARPFDMLITDVNMPDTDALEMVSEAIEINPDLKILVLTVNPESVFATRFLQLGVKGYVNKREPDDIIIDAIQCVSRGKRYITESLANLMTQTYLQGSEPNPFNKLSKREFEVTMLLLQGLGALEIGNTLGISSSTASSFRCKVFDKLGIKNILELKDVARNFKVEPQ